MKILEILQNLHPQFDYEKSDDFIKDGLIDSFDLARLIAELDRAYGIEIAGTDVLAENFRSLGSISDMLARYGVQDAL